MYTTLLFLLSAKPSEDFTVNMAFICSAAVVIMILLLSGTEYEACKEHGLPHPLIKTKQGLSVAPRDKVLHNKIKSYEVIKANIKHSENQEHLNSMFNMLEQFKNIYGDGSELNELKEAFRSKQIMIGSI